MNSTEISIGLNLLGLIFGLGSATVIIILGFLSLFKNFWFKILNGTDRVTIPLLWVGTILLALAYLFLPSGQLQSTPISWRWILWIAMTINGSYLTFMFAPVIRLLENREDSTFLTVPKPHNVLIFIGGTVSALAWSGQAFLFWYELIQLL